MQNFLFSKFWTVQTWQFHVETIGAIMGVALRLRISTSPDSWPLWELAYSKFSFAIILTFMQMMFPYDIFNQEYKNFFRLDNV